MAEEVLVNIKIDGPSNEAKVDELTKSLHSLTEENSKLIQQNNQLAASGKQSSQQFLDNARQIELNKQKIAENAASRRGLIQTIIAEEGSIKALKVQNAELIKQRDLITTKTEQGRAKIAAYNAQIDKNTKAIRDNSSAHEKQRFNIGNYSSALDGIVPGLGMVTTKLMGMINPLTAVLVGLGGLATAYAKSTIGAKDVSFVTSQIAASFTILSNEMASLVSSAEDGEGALTKLYNFILRSFGPAGIALSAASKGIVDAQEAMEDLVRDEIDVRGRVSERLAENQELLTEINDDATTYVDKLRLVNDIHNNLLTNQQELVQVNQKQLEQLQRQLDGDRENEDLQTKVKEKAAEIEKIKARTTKEIEKIVRLEDNIRQSEEQRVATEKNREAVAAFRLQMKEEEKKDHEEKLDILNKGLTAELQLQTKFADLIVQTRESMNKKIQKGQERANDIFIANQMAVNQQFIGLASDVGDSLRQVAGKNKGLAAFGVFIERAAALAQIVMSTVIANAKAIAASPLTLGQPWVGINTASGFAAGASVVASGARAISQINSAQYDRGGHVKFGRFEGPSDENGGRGIEYVRSDGRHRIRVGGGENFYILNRKASREIGMLSSLNVAHGGRSFGNRTPLPSFALGGSVAGPSSPVPDLGEIVRAIEGMNIFVAVKDINTGQAKFAQVVQSADAFR